MDSGIIPAQTLIQQTHCFQVRDFYWGILLIDRCLAQDIPAKNSNVGLDIAHNPALTLNLQVVYPEFNK